MPTHTLRHIACIVAIAGLCACSSPTSPAPIGLSDTVHAQESTEPLTFPNTSGISAEGTWLFIHGARGTTYGPIGLAGSVHFTMLPGSGVRALCADGTNAVVPCSGVDEIADLRRQVQELRAMVAALSR